jgi:LacI family transcriptional regulator, repressor for deo operon, udp, cdd, tsx, nupC, and nupG
LAGIGEIAERTGLSKATVSRALRGLPTVAGDTVALVRRAADDLGYIPSAAASGLATGRNQVIGAVVPVLDRWFYTHTLEGADEELRARGYDLMLYNLGGGPDDRDRVFHRSILRRRIDALLVLALAFNPDEAAELEQAEFPTLAVGGPASGVRHIGVDDHQVAYLATAHLVELGHTRIAHIGGQDVLGLNQAVPANRLGGYRLALTEAGIPVREDWVVDGRYSFAGGAEAARQLFADPRDRPTAIFAASDETAFGAITAMHALGIRVPDDVSVVGIDGHEDGVQWGLTTVAQFPAEQGRMAARQLLDELDGAARPEGFDPSRFEFVVRSSTGRPRR